MIDGQAILQQALSGMAPATWQVLPARRSHFVGQIAGGIVGALALLAAIGYLVLNPDFAVGLQGSTNSPGVFSFWRILDFVVLGALILAALAYAVVSARDMGTMNQQALVLMPEGFVMQKGASPKTLSTIAYEAIGTSRMSISSGNIYLLMSRANSQGTLKLQIDSRFGPAKQLTQRIVEAQLTYARAHARG